MHAATFLLLAILPAGANDGPDEVLEVPSAMVKISEQLDVPAAEAGILASLAVREGQSVREGDRLAQVMDTEAQLALTRAQLELAMARKSTDNDVKLRFSRKSAEVAHSELRRAQGSVERFANSISRSEMEHLQLLSEKADLEVEEADLELQLGRFTRDLKENDLRLAREKVDHYAIRAPLGGVVVQLNRHAGEWVKPGDSVLRIVRMDRLRVEGFLKMGQLNRRLPGCRVELHVEQPAALETPFVGKVVFISPEIDPVNTQVRVWAEVANEGLRLRPGMRGKLVIHPQQAGP